MEPQPRIFRTQALQQYAGNREKTVLPRTVAPPVFLGCWLLLGLLLLATVLVWQAQAPVYAVVFGALVKQHPTSHQVVDGLEAVIFVPATPTPEVKVGDAVTVQVVLTGQRLSGTIAETLPGVITPDEARQRYALTGDLALVIRQPSVVLRVSVGSTLPPGVVAGSSVNAQVRAGSQSILSLLPMLLQGFLGG